MPWRVLKGLPALWGALAGALLMGAVLLLVGDSGRGRGGCGPALPWRRPSEACRLSRAAADAWAYIEVHGLQWGRQAAGRPVGGGSGGTFGGKAAQSTEGDDAPWHELLLGSGAAATVAASPEAGVAAAHRLAARARQRAFCEDAYPSPVPGAVWARLAGAPGVRAESRDWPAQL
jgi:hypothetical protein